MLSSFYTSKQWINLMCVIKHERLNENGENICEYCGKPIVRAYDCIGHHKNALTEENYQDAAISLNPDNIMLVHHRCHNKIHDRLGLSYERQVYLVYGSPMSGKTTWVNDNKRAGDLIIDMDSIWQCLSGCERYVKPNRLKRNAFILRDTMLNMVKYRTGNWLNAYIIGGYPLQGERERLIKELGAREIFIDEPMEVCLERLSEANDSRDKEQWTEFIMDWFEKYSPPPN